jgi:hypothetical protein
MASFSITINVKRLTFCRLPEWREGQIHDGLPGPVPGEDRDLRGRFSQRRTLQDMAMCRTSTTTKGIQRREWIWNERDFPSSPRVRGPTTRNSVIPRPVRTRRRARARSVQETHLRYFGCMGDYRPRKLRFSSPPVAYPRCSQ